MMIIGAGLAIGALFIAYVMAVAAVHMTTGVEIVPFKVENVKKVKLTYLRSYCRVIEKSQLDVPTVPTRTLVLCFSPLLTIF